MLSAQYPVLSAPAKYPMHQRALKGMDTCIKNGKKKFLYFMFLFLYFILLFTFMEAGAVVCLWPSLGLGLRAMRQRRRKLRGGENVEKGNSTEYTQATTLNLPSIYEAGKREIGRR